MFITFVLVFVLINLYIKNNFNFTLAEMTFFLTKEKFLLIVSLFTDREIQSYLLMATVIDVVWPITYCLFFYSLNYKTILNKEIRKYINFYILFIFLIDMCENYLTVRFLLTNNINNVPLCVLATNIKWFAILIIVVISIINLYKYLKKYSFSELIQN